MLSTAPTDDMVNKCARVNERRGRLFLRSQESFGQGSEKTTGTEGKHGSRRSLCFNLRKNGFGTSDRLVLDAYRRAETNSGKRCKRTEI